MWVGTCEGLANVDHGVMTNWITAIPFSEWPQQHQVDDQLRPAMQSDPSWHGFGAVYHSIDKQLADHLREFKISNRMLSVVMPGHTITKHKDTLGPEWAFRVHVPLITNLASKFAIEGLEYQMVAGWAYKVNISREHWVFNYGCVPRIHFMFDCYV